MTFNKFIKFYDNENKNRRNIFLYFRYQQIYRFHEEFVGQSSNLVDWFQSIVDFYNFELAKKYGSGSQHSL